MMAVMATFHLLPILVSNNNATQNLSMVNRGLERRPLAIETTTNPLAMITRFSGPRELED